MIEKILVPLDGTESAEHILPYVEDLLRQNESVKTYLLQIVNPKHQHINIVGPNIVDYEYYNKAVSDAFAYLGSIKTILSMKGYEVEIYIADGPPVDGIVETAEKFEVDLIAMASHGKTGLSAGIHGSVASSVLHNTNLPMLLIRSNGNMTQQVD